MAWKEDPERKRARNKAYHDAKMLDPEYREKQREKNRLAVQRWRERNPGLDPARSRARRYSITEEEAAALASRPVCDICQQPFTGKRAIDHDHAMGNVPGCVRGVVCYSCNQGLTHFKDSPAALRMAADYLDRHRAAYPLADK